MNSWQKDIRSCYKYNIENVSNHFLIKAGMYYWKEKSLNMKLIIKHTETAFEQKC